MGVGGEGWWAANQVKSQGRNCHAGYQTPANEVRMLHLTMWYTLRSHKAGPLLPTPFSEISNLSFMFALALPKSSNILISIKKKTFEIDVDAGTLAGVHMDWHHLTPSTDLTVLIPVWPPGSLDLV